MSGHHLDSRYARLPQSADPRGRTIADIDRTVVCGPCGDVVGPADDFYERGFTMVQTGSCPAHAGPAESTWPSYDYNRFVELCRCCGRVPLRSGSRWSVWFCAECRDQVDLLNQRLGRYAIPIGRHSIHAGRLLSLEKAADPVTLHAFLEGMNAASEAMGVLEMWAHEVTRLNLRAIREESDSVVSIERYCLAARRYVDPSDRFREMCAWLARQGRESRPEQHPS
jgi:hypothetical protein